MSILEQLPRLSAYDPGATGEGGLDPLGLSAIADRLANVLVPGIRARMSKPRFVSLSAIGAIACQELHERNREAGMPTADIAFEWMVVEAFTRHPGKGRTDGLPGSQKAARAKAANERLSPRTYLSGPRVFGFTGVYRPFSRDARVLTLDDMPEKNAAVLTSAWERDRALHGYTDGTSSSPGGKFRKEIADECKRTMEAGECTAPLNGQLIRNMATFLASGDAELMERKALRGLIVSSEHEIRNELAALLTKLKSPTTLTQRDLTLQMLPVVSSTTRQALQAAFAYEEAATALDYCFKRFLAHATQQNGCIASRSTALDTPGLADAASRISDLVKKASSAINGLADTGLSADTSSAFRLFDSTQTPSSFFDALIERHEEVQANKKKLSWLERLNAGLVVRIPYRNQGGDLSDDIWTHPMRISTLATFLAETE